MTLTYKQAAAIRDGLQHLGFQTYRIWATIGNSPGLDAYKYDANDPIHMDADGKAAGFGQDEQFAYQLEIQPGKENDAPGASVDLGRMARKFTSRGDGLSDYFSTAAEVPMAGGQPPFNVVLNWPEVIAAWTKRLNDARDKMGV